MRRCVLGALCLLALSLVSGSAAKPAAPTNRLTPLVRLLASSNDVDLQRDVLRGMYEALEGRRGLAMPDGWPAVADKLKGSPDAEVRQKALMLSVMFGDQQALASLRHTAEDATASAEARRTALQMLVQVKAPDLLPLLRDLVGDRVLRGSALRGLATFKDPGTPALILQHYASFSEGEKADAIATLASRPEYALALLDAVGRQQVPRRDVSAFTARQILNFKDRHLTERLTQVWGSIRPPAQDKAVLLARYQAVVAPDALKKADRAHGRAVFVKTCATCHSLFGEGGKIGPDLTGSQRDHPDYLLGKVLDPSAVVSRDYQVTIFQTIDGRVLNGIIKSESDKTVTVQTQNELLTLPKGDIEERQRSEVSMMPEGQLGPMTDAEVRDLIAYLAGPTQVPLPPQATGSKPKGGSPPGR